MANHGLIKNIQFILERERQPLRVAVITEMVDALNPIPFRTKKENISSLLAMEVRKQNPRWRRTTTGTYAAQETTSVEEAK